MAKKKQFDWKTHTKPVRLLSPAQEDAFSVGVLRPLLERALNDASYRLEVRARSANLYRHGVSLVRITGDGPFVAEIETESGVTRTELSTPSDVANILVAIDGRGDAGGSRREVVHALASVNAGADLFADELIVVDSEYNLGQRKIDLVALRRSEGVTGPGGFANPELVFVDVRCCGQTLVGNAGLAALAADFAEFAKALSGDHLARAKAEISELVAQKVRLGLLPEGLELRGFTDELPELLVLFSDYPVTDEAYDRPLVDLAEKLAARHYPATLLQFAHYVETPEAGDVEMALREGEVVPYRAFKSYRQASRG